MTGAAEPFSDAELETIFASLRRYRRVALAVSGGGDSMALLHLFARWTGMANPAFAGERLVLTVDHALRAESTAEAAGVARQAAGLGLPHETLRWIGDKPRSGVQNAAREARYMLMVDRLSKESGRCALVTAHTDDDQAETLLMRLARGSGLEGLSGMPAERPLSTNPPIDLVRPLLAVSGTRLRQSLRHAGIPFFDDPTNFDPAYERPRLRQMLPSLRAIGLDSPAISRSAGRLRRADEAIAWAVRRLADEALTERAGLTATVLAAPLRAAPAELRIRLLAKVLDRYGGEHPSARLAEIERLDTSMTAAPAGQATLGGCVVAWTAERSTFHRETGRAGLPILVLDASMAGRPLIWDRRFVITLAPGAIPVAPDRTVTVRAPTPAEWAKLRAEGRSGGNLATALAVTLPLPEGYGPEDAMAIFQSRGLHVFEGIDDLDAQN